MINAGFPLVFFFAVLIILKLRVLYLLAPQIRHSLKDEQRRLPEGPARLLGLQQRRRFRGARRRRGDDREPHLLQSVVFTDKATRWRFCVRV